MLIYVSSLWYLIYLSTLFDIIEISIGIISVGRIERSRRYKISSSVPLTNEEINSFVALVHDRMTECLYVTPLSTFTSNMTIEQYSTVPILSKGSIALKELNQSKGLGFDEWDIEFYTNMFKDTLKRDPTDVECFDLAQSNSEHSR